VTPARSLWIATVAVSLLIGARPMAGDEQFPRGLMATARPKAEQSCSIETRPLSFGTYDPLSDRAADATGQIIYVCSKNKNISIALSEGSSNSFDPREMLGPGGQSLRYNIYLDATRQTIWGNGRSYTEVYVDLKPPRDTPVIVATYGRIFRGQEAPAGQYTDTITATINF
jgi:spore coat protein U domain-containing protein, fimbrial subunit CupE1/2/3/6